MDKIELVVTHEAGSPVCRYWSAIFGMAGGTVGRAGQNKLVLPDDDAMVARVHAMVRLDSDRAYIANLCERRSVRVNGLEVLSGQEVPLVPGTSIGIGPYQLRAVIPGQHQDAQATQAKVSRAFTEGISEATSAAGSDTQPGTSTPSANAATSAIGLASLPNPWADIPDIVGGDAHLSGPLLSSLPEAPSQHDAEASPFAMLGRVEARSAAALVPERSANGPGPAAALTVAQSASAAPVTDGLHADIPTEHAPPHPFDISAATARPTQAPPTAHRAMVIPDDFDPFAVDPREQALQRDPWSGNLAAKSLAEVVQLKNDGLLQALPKTGHLTGEMDNAAHTGLPKQLDPAIELNPLKLFREPGESMYVEPEDHGMSRGSDLAQVFNMPRDAQRRHATALPAAVTHGLPATNRLNVEATPVAAPPVESVVEAGLHAMQGLDLALFDGGDAAQALREEDLLKIADIQPPHLRENAIPTHATQPASPPAPTPTAADAHVTAQTTVASSDALAAAFLQGAGIEQGKAHVTITPDFMRAFGEALRVAVQGSIDLLSARSEIKREFRADVTIITSGANNPLKFLPTADGVMLQLIGQTFPGFMKPVPAMKEAYKDLAVHQIALMAGIRAAYAEAVASLSPAELEKNAAVASSLLTKISRVHRKAALWDDFQQQYDSVRRHAEDDLMAFSGKTFVNAYEAAAQSAEEHS